MLFHIYDEIYSVFLEISRFTSDVCEITGVSNDKYSYRHMMHYTMIFSTENDDDDTETTSEIV